MNSVLRGDTHAGSIEPARWPDISRHWIEFRHHERATNIAVPRVLGLAVTLSQNLYRRSPPPWHDAGGSLGSRHPASAPWPPHGPFRWAFYIPKDSRARKPSPTKYRRISQLHDWPHSTTAVSHAAKMAHQTNKEFYPQVHEKRGYRRYFFA